MKTTKRILAVVLAVMLFAALGVSALAADVTRAEGVTGSASITVTLPTDTTNGTVDSESNTYKIYKVFDAISNDDGAISYTRVSGKTIVPAGFSEDAVGNVTYTGDGLEGDKTKLNATDIEAIKGYVTDADIVATVTTTKADTSFTVDNLPYGYYYISTTTGSVVVVDSTNPTATVNDKNLMPGITSAITAITRNGESANGDIAQGGQTATVQVGDTVTYTITVYPQLYTENYVVTDTFGAGLTDITITAKDGVYTGTVDGQNISVTIPNPTSTNTIAIVVTAVVGPDAAIGATDAATKNVDPATLTYGPEGSKTVIKAGDLVVYTGRITVDKYDGSSLGAMPTEAEITAAGRLDGVKFVLKKGDLFYKQDATTKAVTWVSAQTDATELTTDTNGALSFDGLANGTYTLVETEAKAGYNKAADLDVTINNSTNTDAELLLTAQVRNNKGIELPSTGGIGTTIFYIVGGALMIAAVIFFVTKRRMGGAD